MGEVESTLKKITTMPPHTTTKMTTTTTTTKMPTTTTTPISTTTTKMSSTTTTTKMSSTTTTTKMPTTTTTKVTDNKSIDGDSESGDDGTTTKAVVVDASGMTHLCVTVLALVTLVVA